MWPSHRLLTLIIVVLLAGCASSGAGAPREKSSAQHAAKQQVDLGQQYLTRGELETAQDKLRRALELDPKSVEAHTLLAILNERINRPEAAEKFYRKAVELKPEDGSVNNNYGTFLCASGRYPEADQHFQTALADPFYKTPAVAVGNAGVCARKQGDSARAEQYFRRALDLDPTNLTALYELAALSYARNDYLRARAFIQRFEAKSPADASLLILAIRVEAQLGDASAEQAYRDRLASEFPDVEFPAERTSDSP